MIPPAHLNREEQAMYDAIVIGARCGGAPFAMLLARAGRRVLLVDRATFPSEVLSGHAIQPAGVARLARWGILERVRATGTPFTQAVRFDAGPVVLEGVPTPSAGVADTVCIRRTVIDTLLVGAAAEAGVEVREGCTVKELVFSDGRVTGVRGRDSNGRPFTEKAAVVIGADGMHSLVARSVGAGAYHQFPAVSVNAYSYWAGLDVSAVELYVRPGRFIVAVPTNDDLVIINQGAVVADQAAYRADMEKEFRETLQLAPGLAERVAGGERVERFRFTTQTEGFFRVPAGPGWALVGDAGYHKDPITAQGMLDAFRDAELLAEAVDRGLERGPVGLDHALAGYQAARDKAALPMYELTCRLARLEPPDEVMAQLLSALAGNPADTSRFLGIIAGSVPVTDFMDPANVNRILGRLAA
jgi:2-polyprenyl-6-methoxyphenol hydroxylase-like FAD-dependent oxidoreductase